jgi:hypothetical protein
LEPVNSGTAVVMAAKLPYEQIDHLLGGAGLFLAVDFIDAAHGAFLWSAMAVMDDDLEPFYLQRTYRQEDLHRVATFLSAKDSQIALFDELSRCVATLHGRVEGGAAAARRLASWSGIVAPNRPAAIDTAMTARADEIDRRPALLRELPYIVKWWKAVKHFSHLSAPSPVSDPGRARSGTRFGDRNVGPAVESDITKLLSTIFTPDNLFPSPFTGEGTHMRELIDVVAISSDAIMLFEAKAVQSRPGADLSRRAANGQKSLRKAVKQLEGARRRVLQASPLILENAHVCREFAAIDSIYLIAVVGEFAAAAMTAKPELDHDEGARSRLCILQLSDLSAMVSASADPDAFRACMDEVCLRQDAYGYEMLVRPPHRGSVPEQRLDPS